MSQWHLETHSALRGGGLKMKIKNEVEGLDLKEKEEKIDKNKIL